MPELPEVETTKTSLNPLLGQTVQQVTIFQPKLRWPMPSNLADLVDYQLDNVERRAKYLILNFISKDIESELASKSLIIHLGMSGSLQQYPLATEPRKHDHLIIKFTTVAGKVAQLHYHDPRRFGAVLWHEEYGDKLLNHLGPEPLSEDFDSQYLYDLIQRQPQASATTPHSKIEKKPKRAITRAIKSVIMDQAVVVGVGNIYATEALYLAGIHPAAPADSLTKAQLDELVKHIKIILAKSIKLGGSTLRDFTVASGQTGYFQQTLHVYGRQGEACNQCGEVLENIKLNARASVFCPQCQPLL